jgi:two-component system, LytTR family, response regulator
MKINCIIVDDEPLAQNKLEGFILKTDFLSLQKSFNNAIEAISFIKSNPTLLVFLDIEMKDLTGIQMLESLSERPKVIITTAYEKYAVTGFDLQVSDYLLKPITFDRFLKACNKVLDELSQPQVEKDKIFIKTEHRLEGIFLDSILFIEGMRDYRKIVLKDKKIMTLQTFKDLQNILPDRNFCRVHNSYIVAVNKIEKVERNRIKIGDKLIPVSDSYNKEFFKKIMP